MINGSALSPPLSFAGCDHGRHGTARSRRRATPKRARTAGGHHRGHRTPRVATQPSATVLDGSGIDNDVKVYPGAGHSFMNNHPGKLATFAGAAGKDAALPRVFTVVSLLSDR